nr:MAG TPA: hypothetical protein [Caudoviricetes sp.]
MSETSKQAVLNYTTISKQNSFAVCIFPMDRGTCTLTVTLKRLNVICSL